MERTRAVIKPTKQRKRLFQAPAHMRYKLFGAPLSPELKASHAAKALPVRRGDSVRIMRGEHKGFEGKITRVDRREYRIYVEGLTREKVDGTTIFVPVHPSKVRITRLNLEDKWRKKILERKKVAGKKIEEVAKEPIKEVAETKEEVIVKKPRRKTQERGKKETKKPRAKKAKEKAEEIKEEKKPRAKRKRTEKTKEGT